MADIVINDSQQEYIRDVIDEYIKLHKEAHRMYCNYPEKQKDCEYNGTYDCTECSKKYYEERKNSILKKCGLGAKQS